MKIRVLKSVVAAIAVAVLAACAAPVPIKTYEGPQLAVEDISILMVDRQTFVRDIGGYQTGITFTTKDVPMKEHSSK